MGSTAGPAGSEELDRPQAWERIRECRYGRLAVIVHDTPEIFPVTHVVDHGTVVFRTAVGTKLSACVGHPVAFEVDGVDLDRRLAWSVVVKGRAREIRGTEEMIEALSLPLSPIHPAAKPRFVRIDPSAITGRQFAIAAG
ncbi:pyridoxamine 5'-phosphate oxidase family protein [Cumulibacter manganitolerans]|uniref:pyridoxamine 5'-phosphate oxidase family protein n=1 Tax=Cumulibacter manganitolerans TaxID=1884992 RepID=UPI001E567336|nr:pyridoxamine 5'-phosphate oxidase family protein [Cumulibacter manganitolerans]